MRDLIHRVRLAVDPDTWRKVKIKALEEGVTVSELVDRILKEYVTRG